MSDSNSRQIFTRDAQLDRLTAEKQFDILVIGGGATGAGIAVDAAARGYRVALCDQSDFGKGTSSRSTKLIHGGVRYLEQGNVRLVRDALYERGLLLRNAPHLVYRLPTVVPLYRWWEPAYYRTGLLAYDLLAGRLGMGRSKRLSRAATIEALPTVNQDGLRGGVCYFDGGFNDSRLLINLMQTAVDRGAVCVNYLQVQELVEEDGRVIGAEALDLESGRMHSLRGKVVVNAAGPLGDAVRRMADPATEDWIQPSQGAHITLDRSFLPTDNALIVPKTSDGRVVFAIPWHQHTLVGTTDTKLNQPLLEPRALKREIEFLLETISGCLAKRVSEQDVLSVFAGLRPLVRKDGSQATSKLGRDHAVRVDDKGLVTMLGGKWTTYRKMAEDCVDRCAEIANLPRTPCPTADLPIRSDGKEAGSSNLAHYGADAESVRELLALHPEHREPLDAALPYTVGEAVWAIRFEMARSVEDVISRRLRMLLLNSAAASRAAPRVARLLAKEFGRDDAWVREETKRFEALAGGYRVEGCVDNPLCQSKHAAE